MKKIVVMLMMVAAIAMGSPYNVKLGLAGGISHMDLNNDQKSNAMIWGFYVDIPIISTLHITPSALVYEIKYDNQNKTLAATDISMNIKFNVPLGNITLYGEVITGLTQAQFSDNDGISPHVGWGAGLTFPMVGNLSFFGEGNYRVILRDSSNITNYIALGGVLWAF